MYEFTLPVSGKRITWKPLSRKARNTVLAAHIGTPSMAAFADSAMLAARICEVDGAAGVVSLSAIQEWDDADHQLFEEHVTQKEALRLLQLREKANMNASSLKERVEAAITQMDVASQQMSTAFRMAIEAVNAIEAERDPLA